MDNKNKKLNESIFEINNVTLGYGKKNVIVKDLTLNIKEGDFVSIIGPNGSGKSTILRSLAKILHPKTGYIKYNNKDINFSLNKYLYYLISHKSKLPIDFVDKNEFDEFVNQKLKDNYFIKYKYIINKLRIQTFLNNPKMFDSKISKNLNKIVTTTKEDTNNFNEYHSLDLYLNQMNDITIKEFILSNKKILSYVINNDKNKIISNYYLSKVYKKAVELGFDENELYISHKPLPVNNVLIKIQRFCKLNDIKLNKELYFDQSKIITNINEINSLKENDIDKYNQALIYNYALTLKAKDNQLIYSPIEDKTIYINRLSNYLRNKGVNLKQDYYLTNNNPFIISEWKDNLWIISQLLKLEKSYKFFGLDKQKTKCHCNKNEYLYSFDKTFYLAKEYSKHVSFVPQITNFPSEITVEEFVMMGRYPHNKVLNFVSKEEDIQKVHQALDNVNLLEMKDKYIDDLSGGQKQRAIIALALAQDTETILLDEPTNHLDIRHQLEIIHLLHDLNHKLKKTIILVIHDINHGMKFSDKIVIMNHGQAIEYGPTNNVINKEIIKDVFGVDANVALSQNKKIITDYWIEDLELLKDYHDDDKQEK